MRGVPDILLNTLDVEIWPARWLRARSNRDARALARAHRVLRCKQDGRYLAAELPEGLLPLVPRLRHEAGIDAALDALDDMPAHTRPGIDVFHPLPLHRLQERLDILGIDADVYAENTGLERVAEPAWLDFAGHDRFRRPLWLRADAARAWRNLQAAALQDGVVLESISGYRSHDYQLGIFERKLVRGLSLQDILAVNAAPGYSEHHAGTALDIGTPGEPSAEESFETTAAFDWLASNASGHGFTMSYPRGNAHGIVYEPWHWAFRPNVDPR